MSAADNSNVDRLQSAREHMLKWDLRGRDITDPEVLRVMGEIRREEFVSQAYQWQAYDDGPLPIGMGQTISQPYIVAVMTQALRLNKGCEVLEIGTGSGYQTAVLSRLTKIVYTTERLGLLSESAQSALGRAGVDNVEFYIGDGSGGWPEKRIFDRIIITAAAAKVPEPINEQLKEGGILVAPVGGGGSQELTAFEKRGGKMTERVICGCRFVKLIGKYGFEK